MQFLQRLYYAFQLGQFVGVEEPVVGCVVTQLLGVEVWQYALEAVACYGVKHRHNLVSHLYCFAHQLMTVLRNQLSQSCRQREFGVQHLDVGIFRMLCEVCCQHTEVQQHLHVVFLRCHILSRLLFYQQLHVACHEIHTSLNTQLRTNERGFQERLLAVVLRKQLVDDSLNVLHLFLRLALERLAVEVLTAHEVQRLLAEVPPYRPRKNIISRTSHLAPRTSNSLIQRRSREVEHLHTHSSLSSI